MSVRPAYKLSDILQLSHTLRIDDNQIGNKTNYKIANRHLSSHKGK